MDGDRFEEGGGGTKMLVKKCFTPTRHRCHRLFLLITHGNTEKEVIGKTTDTTDTKKV